MNTPTKSLRIRYLAHIHLLANELDLSEAAYRNTLAALAGERSAADLNETARLKVIGFLASEIAKRNPEPPTTPTPIVLRPVEIVTDEEAASILGLAA